MSAPKVIGARYEIHHELGRGGMGIVYKAFDRIVGREVALKALGDVQSRMALDMFYKEWRILAGLHHPNIVNIFDIGEFDDGGNIKPFFVPPFCFVGSPGTASRNHRNRERAPPVPPTMHSGFVWERSRSLFGCPRNNGQQKGRTYMYSMNQLTIIGFTGSDADAHYTPSGTLVTTLSVATKESWKVPMATGRAAQIGIESSHSRNLQSTRGR